MREIAKECKRNIREDRQRDKKIKRPHFWQCILRFKTSIKIVAISFAIFAVTRLPNRMSYFQINLNKHAIRIQILWPVQRALSSQSH